jgi:hypothetical protein
VIYKIIVAGALVICSFAAHAVEPLAKGAYIGAAIGATEVDDDNLLVDSGLDFRDDEDSSIQINGGYKFNRHFAIEARYIDLGSYDVEGFGVRSDLDIEAISVHAIGILPLGENGWELFAQLGLGRIDTEFFGEDDDETVGAGGFGVRFYPTQNFGIALQADAYAWEAESPSGRDYDVSVSTIQLALNYIF